MNKRILVVDDSRTMRMILSRALVRGGIEIVGEAHDGAAAIEAFDRVRPDLMTIDLNMPNLDGVSVIRQILDRHPDAKIIVISSLQQPEVETEIMEAGALAILAKPVKDDELLKTINDLFARTHA
ncbi:MAG: response regulator [Phycisphaerales bacterium]|nr:response regulator [Phycisphaerales bacterium]